MYNKHNTVSTRVSHHTSSTSAATSPYISANTHTQYTSTASYYVLPRFKLVRFTSCGSALANAATPSALILFPAQSHVTS